MSRRTSLTGLGVCLVALLFTGVVATGVGPELPGPHMSSAESLQLGPKR